MKKKIIDNEFQVTVRRPNEEESFDVGHAEHLEISGGSKIKTYDYDRWLILEFQDSSSMFTLATCRWDPRCEETEKSTECLIDKIQRRFDASMIQEFLQQKLFFPADHPRQSDLKDHWKPEADLEEYGNEDFTHSAISRIVYDPTTNLVALYSHNLAGSQKPLILVGVPRRTSGATISTTQFGHQGLLPDSKSSEVNPETR